MRSKIAATIACSALLASFAAAKAESTLTIATVNNPDMIVMQKYAPKFEEQTGIKLKWLVLEENVLRQRVTTDISTNGGQFDVITIGLLETPLWGKQGWLTPFDELPASYDIDDVLPTIREGLSYQGKLYSAAVLRRKRDDLLPDRPVQEGRPDHAGEADLGPDGRVRRQDQRSIARRLRHLPARSGRLGREHGHHRRHGAFVRRPAVR